MDKKLTKGDPSTNWEEKIYQIQKIYTISFILSVCAWRGKKRCWADINLGRENERDSSQRRNNMSRSHQSKCGLHRACLRLSGESPGARLCIWVILKAIHVKVGWVTCETRFLVFYSSLSTRPRHVCEGLVPRLYQTLRWKWFTLGLVDYWGLQSMVGSSGLWD